MYKFNFFKFHIGDPYFAAMRFILLLLVIATISSCTKSAKIVQHTNRLVNESSPYLLQHAHNPVDWYPWGEDALEAARKDNKLIIISIGYSSCHWCHVMESESFENDSVAQLMNENFISIKVDREERPDIDQIYMEAAQMLMGQGGWPLNCVALPDGKPVFAGTYFPKREWMDILSRIDEMWKDNPGELERIANNITLGLIKNNLLIPRITGESYRKELVDSIGQNWMKQFDYEFGGYNRVPKFPLPSNIKVLLNYYHLTGDDQARRIAELTLTKIGNGGIYDHLGGGFARYSTDKVWKIPHFEKMLYDNAQLLSVYSNAYSVTKDKRYGQIVDETVSFMEQHWLSGYGGFYSSYDADTDGEEGKYYVWTNDELDDLLGEQAELFRYYYNCTTNGNWEYGHNILYRSVSEEDIAIRFNLSQEELEKIISECKYLLLMERANRISPGLDDKMLSAWNGLAISGLVDAYKTFQNEHYLELAISTGEFLRKEMIGDDFRIDRNFKDGRSAINGFLDDYALTIEAFISLYQATFDESWLFDAASLADYVIQHYLDDRSGLFYYTSDLDPELITRKIEVQDNVIPSSNSIMAKNLFYLGNFLYNEEYLNRSDHLLRANMDMLKKYPASYSNWFDLMMMKTFEFYEIAIVGKDYMSLKKTFEQKFIPNAIYMGGENEGDLELLNGKYIEGKTKIYVCKQKMCRLPVETTDAALKQLNIQN